MSLQSQLRSPELPAEEPRQLDPEIGPEIVEVSKTAIPGGLVPADQLPSAAAMLAELFPTEEAATISASPDVLHGALAASHDSEARDVAEDFPMEVAEFNSSWPLAETSLSEEIDLPLVASSPHSAALETETDKAAQSDPAPPEISPAQEIDVSARDANRPSRRRKSAPGSVFSGIALRVKHLLRGGKSKRSTSRNISSEAEAEGLLETSPEASHVPAVAESLAASNPSNANSIPALNDFPNAVADAVAAPLEILADVRESSGAPFASGSLSALEPSPILESAATVAPAPVVAMAPHSHDATAGAGSSAMDSLAHLESEAFSSFAPELANAHHPDQRPFPNSVPSLGEHFEPTREEIVANKAIEALPDVDSSDDDHAIASAIERYANITDPARAKASEFGGHREIAVQEKMQATEPSAPKLEEEQVDLNAILGIERDATLSNPALSYAAASVDIPDIDELPKRHLPNATVARESAVGGQIVEERIVEEPVVEQSIAEEPMAGHLIVDHPIVEPPMPEALAETTSSEKPSQQTLDAPEAPPAIPYRDWSFEEKLASHHEWLESKGKTGKKAEFAGMDLEGTELIGVDLRYLDLHDANLRATDLLMADMRDACLARANLRDACLVGANLEGANLEGATLDSAMGLVPRQLAGANLHDATLPAHILAFDARSEFRRASRTVNAFFTALMSLSVLSWLIVWMTKDFQLITNSAILPFLHSSTAAAAMPTQQFYLIAPFALFIVYLVFHFHLQRLWDLSLELPAIFPDGRALGENEPRIVLGLLRTHFRWMNQEAPSTRIIEKFLSVLIAYWVVPATLFFYWLRFLTLQNVHGTVLQMFLVVGAAGAALYSTTRTGKPAESWTLQENALERIVAKCKQVNPVTAALVVLGILTFLSAGTMAGVPHGKDRAPQFASGSIRRWAPSVLWAFGVDPYADITEAVISTKPANWNGSDEQVSSVKGARLNDSNFRYAQAYRVFLANAHLLHAKFQGAFLSQADLRGADLGQSDLRYAILDQSLLTRANLDRAVLDGANLSRADIHAANLSYTSLAGATLVDARLDGATLYGAKLPFATLIRTNFEKADLRESHLEGANLEHANMQGAYLWSAKLAGARLTNAQLGTAIFVDVNLRGADLRWAQLHGTVLTGSDLTGALLDGADFRGAVGYGPDQICSAKSRLGLLLDDPMQAQVMARCGAAH